MKKIIGMSLCLIMFVGCASVKDLEKAQTCKVWEEQPVLGPFAVDANKEFSRWEGRCAILGLFACEWVKTDMSKNNIFQDSNGIFNSRTKVATFTGDTFVYERFYLEKLFDIKPVKIDMDKKVATYQVDIQNPLGGKLNGERIIKFNNACSAKEVAMGAVTLITSKNKIN